MNQTIRRGPGRPLGAETLESSLAAYLLTRAAELDPPEDDGTTWPSTKYQHRIIEYCFDVLGVKYLTKTQRRVLLAIQRAAHEGGRVAVKAGRKIGKTFLGAAAALWFFCSFSRARVWLTAPKIDQVDDLVWQEIRELHRKLVKQIDGTPAEKSETGLVAPDDRSIKGRVARTQEAGQGYSGRQFYICDEATGITAMHLSAIEGNRAGGKVPILLIANPTRDEGELFDAFHTKKAFYGGGDPELGPFTISSEESPNVTGECEIEGMADPAWIAEMAEMHGRDSAWFQVNVLGEFATGETGKIIKLETIVNAERRANAAEGTLIIGCDPAGAGPGGDEGVLAPRRGRKALGMRIMPRGSVADDYVREVERIIEDELPGTREQAVVVVDREGSVGAEVYGALRADSNRQGAHPARFRVYGVRAGQRAEREPMTYDLTRDELWAAGARWLKTGSIPEDAQLAQDLHAPAWSHNARRRMIATDKKELRKKLGRSTDRGDALCLAVWIEGDEVDTKEAQDREREELGELRAQISDPYGAADAFNPYK